MLREISRFTLDFETIFKHRFLSEISPNISLLIASCDTEDLMYSHAKSYLSALFTSFCAVFDQNVSTSNCEF